MGSWMGPHDDRTGRVSVDIEWSIEQGKGISGHLPATSEAPGIKVHVVSTYSQTVTPNHLVHLAHSTHTLTTAPFLFWGGGEIVGIVVG